MSLMTTARVKELLGITVADYDAQIALFEPIAESRVNSYLGYNLTELSLGYEPYYARLVWVLLTEGSITAETREISSKSIGKVSVNFVTDTESSEKGVAKNTENALSKFKPLKKRIY